MSKRRKRSGSKPHTKNSKIPEVVFLEYYSRPFALLEQSIEQYGYDIRKPHEIRKRFWGLLPPKVYEPLEITPLLKQYNKSIERELATVIQKHSLAYWLHLYRRIGPYPAGVDEKPMTIALVRLALETAFQKYAQFDLCDSIGVSQEVPIEKILSGLLISDEFKYEREAIEDGPKQMVLTNFSSINLFEIYNIEKLAYELWKSMATLRIVGKGSSITVVESEPYFFDNRSDELDKLIQVFDDRHRGNISSSLTGTAYSSFLDQDNSGTTIFPTYNVGHISSEKFNELLSGLYKISLMTPVVFNFIWTLFDVKSYRLSHMPFSEKFHDIHKVELDSVLLVITALCNRVLINMSRNPSSTIIRYWQRAYEGPVLKELVIDEILYFASLAAKTLDISSDKLEKEKILDAINFLELTTASRDSIDLEYPGAHKIFLPYENDRWFIDYAWLHSSLYNLFIGVSPDDQKFKGDLLENVVNFKKSVLPTKPCKSLSGESKQVDASFDIGNRLIIVECKAINKSIAFDKGETLAIRFRNDKFTKALNEVDEKANWLMQNPLGTNYDVRQYQEIVPLVVSPFIEYVPSLNGFYWLDPDTPRILTPKELKSFLDDGKLSGNLYNIVKLVHDS